MLTYTYYPILILICQGYRYKEAGVRVEDENGGVHCTPLGVLADGEVDSFRCKHPVNYDGNSVSD